VFSLFKSDNVIDCQQDVIEKSEDYRPSANYPAYPPYHTGPYIEEYFFNYFIKNSIETKRIYIPIFWTNINNNAYYSKSDKIKFGKFLKKLDQDKKYFTVCQHEDFTDENNLEPDEKSLENLPTNILIFSGSGKINDKYRTKNIIPIPHVVSKIPEPKTNENKDFLCSFVGSFNTHPIRNEIYEIYKDDKDFHFCGDKKWKIDVNKEREQEFKNITEKSLFTLCPRGNGPTSYRLYESMQLGSIPIYIHDDNKWIPWQDEINWEDICILFKLEETSFLGTYLRNMSNSEINEMRNKIKKIYDEYFTMEKVCETIIRKMNKGDYEQVFA